MIITINASQSHADFSMLRGTLQLFGTEFYVFCFFFSEKIPLACRFNHCIRSYKYYRVLHENTVKNFAISFCMIILKIFQLLYLLQKKKKIGFLTGLVSTTFAIENAFATKPLRYQYHC